MKHLDDGPDGIDERAWERALQRRTRRARGRNRQPISTLTQEPAMAQPQPRELPPLAATPAETAHFLQAKERRLAKKSDLVAFFDAAAELRCSPPIFEREEPGARETLLLWARARKLRIEEKQLAVDAGRYNRVTVAHTHHEHAIEVYWTASVEERAA